MQDMASDNSTAIDTPAVPSLAKLPQKVPK